MPLVWASKAPPPKTGPPGRAAPSTGHSALVLIDQDGGPDIGDLVGQLGFLYAGGIVS